MNDYLGRVIRFRTDTLGDWEHGTVITELPSPITGETDRVLVALDREAPSPSVYGEGMAIVSTLAIVWLHLAQIDVLDPIAPDYGALAAEMPASQIEDSRDAALGGEHRPSAKKIMSGWTW